MLLKNQWKGRNSSDRYEVDIQIQCRETLSFNLQLCKYCESKLRVTTVLSPRIGYFDKLWLESLIETFSTSSYDYLFCKENDQKDRKNSYVNFCSIFRNHINMFNWSNKGYLKEFIGQHTPKTPTTDVNTSNNS